MTNERKKADKARKIMNEAKARELAKCSTCFCAKWCKGIDSDCCDEFENLLAMAEWKDRQIKSLCKKTQWIFDKKPDDCRIVLAAILSDGEPQLYVGYYLQSKQAWYLNDYGYRNDVYCWMDIPEVQPLKAMEE